jgi:hypothetical protein
MTNQFGTWRFLPNTHAKNCVERFIRHELDEEHETLCCLLNRRHRRPIAYRWLLPQSFTDSYSGVKRWPWQSGYVPSVPGRRLWRKHVDAVKFVRFVELSNGRHVFGVRFITSLESKVIQLQTNTTQLEILTSTIKLTRYHKYLTLIWQTIRTNSRTPRPMMYPTANMLCLVSH